MKAGYIADDGTFFVTETEALKYEAYRKRKAALAQLIKGNFNQIDAHDLADWLLNKSYNIYEIMFDASDEDSKAGTPEEGADSGVALELKLHQFKGEAINLTLTKAQCELCRDSFRSCVPCGDWTARLL